MPKYFFGGIGRHEGFKIFFFLRLLVQVQQKISDLMREWLSGLKWVIVNYLDFIYTGSNPVSLKILSNFTNKIDIKKILNYRLRQRLTQ